MRLLRALCVQAFNAKQRLSYPNALVSFQTPSTKDLVNKRRGYEMKINEIANAEEQMALWKLVSDGVWSAISQQSRQQAQERAAKAKLPKPKKRAAPKPAPHVPKPPSLKKAPAQPNLVPKAVLPQSTNPQVHSITQRQQALQARKPLQPSVFQNQAAASKDAENDGEQVEKTISLYRRQA